MVCACLQIELRRFTKSEIVITIQEHRIVAEGKGQSSSSSFNHSENSVSEEEKRKIAALEAEWFNESPQPAVKSSGGIFGKGLSILKAPVKMVVSPVSTVAKVVSSSHHDSCFWMYLLEI